MSQVLWSQDIFTKGEISPLMYARVSVSPYYNGLKTAKICYFIFAFHRALQENVLELFIEIQFQE